MNLAKEKRRLNREIAEEILLEAGLGCGPIDFLTKAGFDNPLDKLKSLSGTFCKIAVNVGIDQRVLSNCSYGELAVMKLLTRCNKFAEEIRGMRSNGIPVNGMISRLGVSINTINIVLNPKKIRSNYDDAECIVPHKSPDGAQYFVNGMHYKIGRHEFIFRHDIDRWTKSGVTKDWLIKRSRCSGNYLIARS